MEVKLGHDISAHIDFENKKYLFRSLSYKRHRFCEDWLTAIDIMEYFSGFSKNILQVESTYDAHAPFYCIVVKQDKNISLAFGIGDDKYSSDLIYFSKLDCNQFVHKLNRILSRCDILGEMNV